VVVFRRFRGADNNKILLSLLSFIFLLPITFIKVIGYSMETRQQVKQQEEEQAPVAVRTRTAAKKVVVVEESRNTTKKFNKYKRRITLPTKSNRGTPPASILKRRSDLATMPPKKKQKTAVGAAGAAAAAAAGAKDARDRDPNFTALEDIFICKAFINASCNSIGSNKMSKRELWSLVHKNFKDLVQQNKSKLEDWVKEVDRSADAVMNRYKKYIAKFVVQFNPFYKRVKESKPSGTTIICATSNIKRRRRRT